MRSRSERHAPEIKNARARRSAEHEGIWQRRRETVAARPTSGDVSDNNALIAGRLIGIKALFSADHGAAAAGLGVTDLGVARFEHFRFGKFRFGLAEQ
jgi:hypothetical protein